MVGMAEMEAPISLDGVAVHAEMYLLLLAHPGRPVQSPESHKMHVCMCVRVCHLLTYLLTYLLT